MKIPTGIFGLDNIIGGFNRGEITTIIGPIGAGKTQFALNFLLVEAEKGTPSLYICEDTQFDYVTTLLENLRNTELDKDIFKIECFTAFETPENVLDLIDSKYKRIAIDPLTPILWEFEKKSTLSQFIGKLYKKLKENHTTIITLNTAGEITQDIAIPCHSADNVFKLTYTFTEHNVERRLKILKIKEELNQMVYQFLICGGLGIIVVPPPSGKVGVEITYSSCFYKAKKTITDRIKENFCRESLTKKLENLKIKWKFKISPEQILNSIVGRYF